MIIIIHNNNNNNNNNHESSLKAKTFRELPCRKQIPKRIPFLYLFPHQKLEGHGLKTKNKLSGRCSPGNNTIIITQGKNTIIITQGNN
jgi:hypothetical protein